MTSETHEKLSTHEVSERDPSKGQRAALIVKRSSQVLIVLGLLALLRQFPMAEATEALRGWVEGLGALAPVAFIGTYLIATILMLPASPLSVAAGVIFGLFSGTLFVLAGATLGMAATFLIGRYLARPAVERRFSRNPRFAAIDRAVGQGGWRIVALLRLSPAVPFNVQNYLYGLTSIRFWPCVLASAAAILPGTFMYVYLGYAGRAALGSAGSAEAGNGMARWILLVIGLAATIAVTVYVTRLARKAIREQTEMDTQDEPPAASKRESQQRAVRNPWIGAAAAAAAALVTLGAAASIQFGLVPLSGFFGPPPVSLAESYADSGTISKFDHTGFDSILRRHVNGNGGVDYAALRDDRDELRTYIESLAQAPFEDLERDAKLALLVNAYNAFTLELVVEWLDKDIRSIRDIPAEKRWDDQRWNVGGNVWSLNQIEHEQIRPNFREPNIHFALVCAAVGCPPLRAEAYVAERVVEQLDDQARTVHTDGSRWFQFDSEKRHLRLTALYDWYGGDFEQVAGAVVEYAARYSPMLREMLDTGKSPRVEWLDYDWSLNNQENLN